MDSSIQELYEHMFDLPELSTYTEYVLEHIGGFIVKQLQKKIHCIECLNLVEGEFNPRSLIYYKSMGYLKYPSKGLLKILKLAEQTLKFIGEYNKKTFLKVKIFVQKALVGETIFEEDSFQHNELHKCPLIALIIERYLNVRFFYEHKKSKEQKSVRMHNNHMTLFKGQ